MWCLPTPHYGKCIISCISPRSRPKPADRPLYMMRQCGPSFRTFAAGANSLRTGRSRRSSVAGASVTARTDKIAPTPQHGRSGTAKALPATLMLSGLTTVSPSACAALRIFWLNAASRSVMRRSEIGWRNLAHRLRPRSDVNAPSPPTNGTWTKLWSRSVGKSRLWRAVDGNGDTLEILMQSRRNAKAAKRFLRKLMKRWGTPRVIATDKLRSYGVATRELCPRVDHGSHKGLNNRGEATRRPPPLDGGDFRPGQISKTGSVVLVGPWSNRRSLSPETPPHSQ